MQREHSTSHNSIAAVRWAVVAAIFLAGIATGMLSAQGGGGFRGGPRFTGVVTAVTSTTVTAKDAAGVSYTIAITSDTRLMRRGAQGGPPDEINPSDIKVDDVVTASGQIDESAHTVQAMFLIDATGDAAAALRANEANLGKTWTAGRVTAISGTTITIQRIDGATQNVTADANTSFARAPQRGGGGGGAAPEAITLADIKVGDNISADGAAAGDNFVPTRVTVGGQPVGYGGPQAGFGGRRGGNQ